MSATPHSHTLLGLMSGTSLDGLDLALCRFEPQGASFVFRILKAQTLPYDSSWKKRLQESATLNAEAYFKLHAQYGAWLAAACRDFLNGLEMPAAIASHGHTVFHQPQLGFSTQLGCGATLAAHTGITTVCDFRSLDVALGGQGAPLVPVGDSYLFPEYSACLNLGGIANISFTNAAGRRMAYDVCEANMLLNHLAEKAGRPYDANGELARSGTVHAELLQVLNDQQFYKQQGAKSIGREWFEQEVLPLISGLKISNNDLLATATTHIADTLAWELNERQLKNVLLSGGGALNAYLVEQLRAKTVTDIVIPELQIIQFKEALIFAFLGYLRLQGQVNALSSVTGAARNSVGGAIYPGLADQELS